MRRMTLFAPPEAFNARVEELREKPGFNHPTAEVLLHVELAFALMRFLGLDDEPVSAVWAILSGMPLHYAKLENLSPVARRAIANARQIIPYSSRFAWLDALRTYKRDVPSRWRQYDFETDRLDDQIIDGVRRAADHLLPEHEHLYEQCLRTELAPRTRVQQLAKADIPYEFEARTGTLTANVRVQFTQEHIDRAAPRGAAWFSPTSPRAAFSLSIDKLKEVAMFLDEREAHLAAQYEWQASELGNWCKRYTTIHFHTVGEDGMLSNRNEHDLVIDGFVHLAGMVGSGKSTLAQLLAAYIIAKRPDLRMTIVVGDVQTAIQLANQMNWWLCDDPEQDAAVAVPILGRSRRDAHLRGFYRSKDYQAYQQRGQTHWGERWLNTACAVQAVLSREQNITLLDGKPLVPGTEPCQNLREPPTATRKKAGSPRLCPFFNECPSQQLYRDMASARIWITTPGALAMSAPPRHLEVRPVKIGELVYEQSDIVVFDEADTVIQWFDNVYAETVTLTNGSNGLLDQVTTPTETYMIGNRTPPPPTQRWVGAERSSQQAVSVILTLLDQRLGHALLRDWVKRGYFTPNTLCYRLARRIIGLPEFDEPGVADEVIEARKRRTQTVLHYFEELLDMADPLQIPTSIPGASSNAIVRLSQIMQQINTIGESAADKQIFTLCRAWIMEFCPDAEQRLAELRTAREEQVAETGRRMKQRRGRSGPRENDEVDTIESLAYRLQFALSVILLDRHTRIVFYQWHDRPEMVEGEQPHRRMPSAMLDILPLPPTGRQFGTYYAQQPAVGANSNNYLSLFAYTNIGRCYVLNYHRLLTDLDGRRGPNVLALSGTSYLPDSTTFHVSDPHGTLLPDKSARSAIQNSYFAFLPQRYQESDDAIRISGKPEQQKAGLFRDMVRELVGEDGSGPLGHELMALKNLDTNDPEHWADRGRMLLLVNSYEQARWAADEVRQRWPSLAKRVFHVRRAGAGMDDEDLFSNNAHGQDQGGLNRTDIEPFANTHGIILVAPLNAIGRGFNIRNSNGKAAFGAVYFLTRPYPHPHDTQSIVQELNRRALEWAADPTFHAWQGDGLLGRAQAVRHLAATYWRSVEQRSYYRTLADNDLLGAHPRHDLAATTAGYIVQAVGRLLRGGVPFHAYFVDAAWAPQSAKLASEAIDTEETSLLVAVILRLAEYSADENTVGWALYKPLADALERTDYLRW